MPSVPRHRSLRGDFSADVVANGVGPRHSRRFVQKKGGDARLQGAVHLHGMEFTDIKTNLRAQSQSPFPTAENTTLRDSKTLCRPGLEKGLGCGSVQSRKP
eukprot:m.152151 g.152151  ORF g.152151 m.152151 type:complete len:101 (-) comp14312_c0_seq4:825-1127(-)